MKFDELKFGLAGAIASTITWLLISVFIMISPFGMMDHTNGMFGSTDHMNMGISMFFTGLFYWALIAGFTAWLFAFIYNRLP